MTPLRQRMIDDMRLAGFAERTRDVYIQAVRRLAAHYMRSPDVLSEEEVRAYLLHLRDERGIARGTFKTNHGGSSLALASLNRACWDHVQTFPQRSPPSLLTTAACGGLRSAPDCRTRRALLHLSYSCAAPFGPAILVTQDPQRSLARQFCCGAQWIEYYIQRMW